MKTLLFSIAIALSFSSGAQAAVRMCEAEALKAAEAAVVTLAAQTHSTYEIGHEAGLILGEAEVFAYGVDAKVGDVFKVVRVEFETANRGADCVVKNVTVEPDPWKNEAK